MINIFLRYKYDFLNICRFWNKEKYYAWLCLWLFVLFNSCSINLCYEWNSLQKNLFHIFGHIKNRFDFSVIKNHFFYYHKMDLIFYKVKTIFFRFLKIDMIFLQTKINFFSLPKQIWNFSPKTIFFYTYKNISNLFI